MAVGDHSSTAAAQPLLGSGEMSWPACRTFDLWPPKVTYNWYFSINWHIAPTGHTFLNDVYLAISKARNVSLSAFIAIPKGFSKIQKFGVGYPPTLGHI